MTAKSLPSGIAAIDERPRRLPRLGIVRPGEKVENTKGGKDYPRELDYFNLTDAPAIALYYSRLKVADLERELAENNMGHDLRELRMKQHALLTELLARVPEGALPDEATSKALSETLKCRELDILFPSNERSMILDTCYKKYGAGGFWQCRGNGVVAVDRDNPAEFDCPGEECPKVKGERNEKGKLIKSCKRMMTLTFLAYKTRGMGVYQYTTTGWQPIGDTLGTLDMFDAMFREFGGFAGIPMKLLRRPYNTSHVDEDGKRHGQIHHGIIIDIAASLEDVQRVRIGSGKMEIAPMLEECDPSMYPAPYREETDRAALPPAQEAVVIEHPAVQVVPDESAEEAEPAAPADDQNAEVNNIIMGFRECNIPEAEWPAFFANYEGRLPELDKYLSTLLDSQLAPIPEAPKAAPKRQAKPAEPTIEKPAQATDQGRWTI